VTGEFSATWLELREPADAAARSADLAGRLRLDPPVVVRDLGCGTGSLGRWLAPRLPGPQHWILHDRDPDLLARAAATVPAGSVETHLGDATALTPDDLLGTSLVTCSALLDLLTAGEVDALAGACAETRTPALFTLSVAGQVVLDPARTEDAAIEAAFNDHQRRTAGGRRLLGPDAPAAAAAAFERAGATVITRPSPWRLGPDQAALTAEWLRGWAAAAADQCPELDLDRYVSERVANPPTAVIGHVDLLAIFG
jgi:SAM-dependent methyltransferase